MCDIDIEVSEKIAGAFINYNKEEFLLSREYKFIDRCKRSMVVAVQTDQKLLHRRFQNLLQDTEIRHAQNNGDKARVRDLRKRWSR